MAITTTPHAQILATIEAQRAYFRSGATLDYAFRCEQLKRLEQALHKYEPQLAEALWKDLHKSYEEAYMTELSIVLGEIRNHLSHLKRWMRPQRAGSIWRSRQ